MTKREAKRLKQEALQKALKYLHKRLSFVGKSEPLTEGQGHA